MPTTGKFPLVQINSVYLTKNSASNGVPCKVEIPELHQFAVTDSIQVIRALDGTPYLQASAFQLGMPVSLNYEMMTEAVYDAVVAIIQAYITSGTAITLTITNTPYASSFALSVIPDENPVRHQHEFSNTLLLNGSFHFITT